MAKELCVIYQHPCSTITLVYIIPKKFDDVLKNDPNFKIGFYRTPFKEYLNKYYGDNPNTSQTLFGKPYIRTVAEVNINEKDVCNRPYKGYTSRSKGEKKEITINNIEMYYYELCSWSLDGPGEYQRFLKRINLGNPMDDRYGKNCEGAYFIDEKDFLI